MCCLLFAFLAAVSAQFDFSGDFGGPSAFAALEQQPRIGVRDPRTDRGPVQFPMSPPASFETSGVVIGASGYGFVPSSRGLPSRS
uniref:Putative secreted protein n=1 Tax=Xenopsylla cheopis TaxID=163159 RepID=A0A6M2DXM6_XENCH